jgi:hypothetical protein
VFLLPQAAHAQCTLASLTGTYAINITGPFSNLAVGTIVSDGAGHLTTTTFNAYEFAIPGTLLPIPGPKTNVTPFPGYIEILNAISQGTYSVNADCTGTLIIHYGLGSTVSHLDFVLVNGQTGMYLIATDQGNVYSGVGQKQ